MPDNQGGVIKDGRGAAVLSKLEPATLEELAQVTGGVYQEASNWVDLAELIKETVAQGKTGDFSKTRDVKMAERFQWFLAPGILLLALSFALEIPSLPTRRRLALGTTTQGEPLPVPMEKKTTKIVSRESPPVLSKSR